ncbi:hypothetical protein [Devosia sp. FKR38]|uniref:hypothetical protein n=1 Tax=Devosia sp. FKR38 TaxID=2562312 RepID=UPI0010C02D3F|nr:hypothetical protein [Devosia sp. FKR38]
MISRTLTAAECNYIRHQLELNDPVQQKRILQRLCSLHKLGFRIPPAARYSLEVFMAGLVMGGSTNAKVTRWCLNALALIGSKDLAVAAVRFAIEKFVADPDIFGSAISAIVRLDPEQFAHIATSDRYPRELVLLGGLRTAGPQELDTSQLSINIDTADPQILKLALLTVGLDRAPEHIFDPRHANPAIVKALGGHQDPVVSQYSVWAISENNKLGVDDLGIATGDMESLPENVRGWIYRLFAAAPELSTRRHDLIFQGSIDPNSEVRLALATGLRDSFYDGLEEVTFDWFDVEAEKDVRDALIDHMVRQAEQFPGYQPIVTTLYAAESPGSPARHRMDAAAARTSMYSRFQEIVQETGAPLFSDLKGATIVMGDNFSTGNIQGGSVSLKGDASNNGDVSNFLSEAGTQDALRILEELGPVLASLPLKEETKAPTRQAITEAKSNPTKERLNSVRAALKGLEESLGSVAGGAAHIAAIAGYFALIAGLA